MNPDYEGEPIANTRFTDGSNRPVFEDDLGQYVIDGLGQRIAGVWYIPREEADTPAIVEDVNTIHGA